MTAFNTHQQRITQTHTNNRSHTPTTNHTQQQVTYTTPITNHTQKPQITHTRTPQFSHTHTPTTICGIRVYSMTMSGTCATHVLTKANPKAVWSRCLRCMQVSLCWWSVNCCVQACKQTQRDTQGTTRAKCAHVGDTNNTPPHANRESGVIQTSNRARVWQIWEARKDT